MTPPPRARDERYDRQVRLWGDVGQSRLERASVCALGVTPATCEALKNLILGGIKTFTLVDDAPWSHARAGELFEISCDDVERREETLAEACARALAELNPDVSGEARVESVASAANASSAYFASFDAVIAGSDALSDADARALERACEGGRTPLVVTRARGLFGECRACAGERWATENVAPEGSMMRDLRLVTPWDELRSYVEMKTSDLDRLDGGSFKHVPFVALLAHAMAACGTRDRRAVKDALTSARRGMDEENFDEALANVRYAWTDTGAVTDDVREIISHERARAVSEESDKFWFLAAGLREFVESEGCLPLEGSIPDMTSTTESYVELQRLYSEKAERDARRVWESAVALAKSVGVAQPSERIAWEDAKTFCKNCRNVKFMTWRPMEEELFPSPAFGTSDLVNDALADSTKTMSVCIFAALRAADKFTTLHGRSPGVYDGAACVGGDVNELVRRDGETVRALMEEWFAASGAAVDGAHEKLIDDVAYEVARYGNSQLHAVGAVLGGIASQELIKIITGQYAPMTKRLIFDAVNCTTNLLF